MKYQWFGAMATTLYLNISMLWSTFVRSSQRSMPQLSSQSQRMSIPASSFWDCGVPRASMDATSCDMRHINIYYENMYIIYIVIMIKILMITTRKITIIIIVIIIIICDHWNYHLFLVKISSMMMFCGIACELLGENVAASAGEAARASEVVFKDKKQPVNPGCNRGQHIIWGFIYVCI